jgi:hypothetical protein
VWCGARKGRTWISGVSGGLGHLRHRICDAASSLLNAGMMPGIARANSVFPAPGGPMSNTL